MPSFGGGIDDSGNRRVPLDRLLDREFLAGVDERGTRRYVWLVYTWVGSGERNQIDVKNV
jgi:hypothetical protein